MKKYLVLAVFLFCIKPLFATEDHKNLFIELDSAIMQQQRFLDDRIKRIEFLKSMLNASSEREQDNYNYNIYDKLFQEYRSFIYDSAFKYANILLETSYELGDKQLIEQSKIKIGFTLLSAGIFKETLDTLLSIKTDILDKSYKIEYYFLLGRTWFDMSDYLQDDYFSRQYILNGSKALKNALSIAQEGSKEYLVVNGLYNLRNKNWNVAEGCYVKLLKDTTLTDQEFAVTASSLAFLYNNQGKTEKAIELLAKAAIADIKTSTRETVAMLNLAELLYLKGDIKRAYKYVNLALQDAYFYGARQRKVQISDILPIIEAEQINIKEKQRKLLMNYSVGLTILSILLFVLVYVVFYQFKKLKRVKTSLDVMVRDLSEINNKLREVNTIKEEYIAHFFDIISEYIKKIERFKKSVSRKVMLNNLNDINEFVQSINLESEREELYQSFDSIFIKIFPNFIPQFNSLFKVEDQFVIEKDKALTPELRIFALIKLGINDNEKIARFLNYSVTTIYTYKTKVKKKAIVPNEEFEARLMKISVD